jgi:hypothetical protein
MLITMQKLLCVITFGSTKSCFHLETHLIFGIMRCLQAFDFQLEPSKSYHGKSHVGGNISNIHKALNDPKCCTNVQINCEGL